MKATLAGTEHDTRLLVWCPACGDLHQPRVKGVNPWGFNGDLERPTVTPSILVTCELGDGRGKTVCHSFLTDGVWHFLSDCTHALAGTRVPLPDLPDGFR